MALIRAVLIVIVLLAACLAALPLHWIGGQFGASFGDHLLPLFCRTMLRLLRVQVRFDPAAPATPPSFARLVIANHVSWLDILVLGTLEPFCFLAKREVGSWPLIATLSTLQGTILVDRGRRRSIPRTNRAMADRLFRGRSVLLFPEGTTFDGTRRGRFLTSHLACLRDRLEREPSLPSCAIQATALAYSDPTASWVGEATLLAHVWALLGRPPMECLVRYGAVRRVERGYDRKRLGRSLQAEVDRLLDGAAPLTPRAMTVEPVMALQG